MRGSDHSELVVLTLAGVIGGAIAGIVGVGIHLVGIATAGAIVGDRWLSPDLDYAMSNATRRWWILKFIWYPYRAMIPHRSPLSHWPIIGTAIRLGYLCTPIVIVMWAFGLQEQAAQVGHWMMDHRAGCVAGLVGIEASAIVHLLCDVARRGP